MFADVALVFPLLVVNTSDVSGQAKLGRKALFADVAIK